MCGIIFPLFLCRRCICEHISGFNFKQCNLFYDRWKEKEAKEYNGKNIGYREFGFGLHCFLAHAGRQGTKKTRFCESNPCCELQRIKNFTHREKNGQILRKTTSTPHFFTCWIVVAGKHGQFQPVAHIIALLPMHTRIALRIQSHRPLYWFGFNPKLTKSTETSWAATGIIMAASCKFHMGHYLNQRLETTTNWIEKLKADAEPIMAHN